MRVVLAHPSELGAAELAAWRSMQRATSSLANPFLAPDLSVGQTQRLARLGRLLFAASGRSSGRVALYELPAAPAPRAGGQ